MIQSMAINEWWSADPAERFWMEISDRDELGADLFAPTTNQSGQPYWGYELVTYVQPADVVLHWHKSLLSEPGIAGWSQATGAFEDTDILWQSRGTYGRSTRRLRPRPAWRMPLTNFAPMTAPLLEAEVRTLEPGLRQALADLKGRFPNQGLYFPFVFSDKRPLRAQQTYLVKMPREVLEVLGLDGLEETAGPSRSVHGTGRSPRRGDSGHIEDSVVRSAIEWRAVNLAIEAYTNAGYAVQYTGSSKPYDLEVTKGSDVRRVEVKGSAGEATSVELTINEVENSRRSSPTDLYVVDGIQWSREADSSVLAEEGDVRWWKDWTATEQALKVLRYRYKLPPGGDVR